MVRTERVTQPDVYDVTQITQTLDCHATDALLWRYQDRDLGTFGEPGETLIAGVRIERECFGIGLQIQSNTFTRAALIDPATGTDYLARTGDELEVLLPAAPGTDPGSWGPAYPPGEVLAAVPESVQELVLLFGLFTIGNDGRVEFESDCNTCVVGGVSAHWARESSVTLEVVNPRAETAGLAVTAPTPDALDVTATYARAHQIDAHACTATRLQAGGRFGAPAGSVIDSVSVLPGARGDVRDWLHTDAGFDVTARLSVHDLQPGDRVEVTCTPQGRSVYGTEPMPDQAVSAEYTVQTATAGEALPDKAALTAQVWPNPAWGAATLSVTTAAPGEVRYRVFDGRRPHGGGGGAGGGAGHLRGGPRPGRGGTGRVRGPGGAGRGRVRAAPDGGAVGPRRPRGGRGGRAAR